MRKILSIAFLLTAFVFVGSASVDAQTWRNQRNSQVRQNRGVQTFTQTKTVWQNGRQYRETYQVRVLPNGRRTTKLISRVQINNGRYNRRNNNSNQRIVRTYYKTDTIRQNGRRYRVTYKVTQYRNGRTSSQVVSRKRI